MNLEISSVLYVLCAFSILAGVFFIFLKKEQTPPDVERINSKLKEVDKNVSKAPSETGETKQVEKSIQELQGKIQDAKDNIAKAEKKIEQMEKEECDKNPFSDPEKAAEWLNDLIKKKNLIVFLFLLSASVSFAADPIYKGKTYLPKDNGVALSLEELNAMKEKIDNAEKLDKVNKEYISLLEEYRKLKDLQQKQIYDLITLDKLKQESIEIYKESVVSYKNIIEEIRESNSNLHKQMQQQKRLSRAQRNIHFLLGFVAPVLGARAMGQLGK